MEQIIGCWGTKILSPGMWKKDYLKSLCPPNGPFLNLFLIWSDKALSSSSKICLSYFLSPFSPQGLKYWGLGMEKERKTKGVKEGAWNIGRMCLMQYQWLQPAYFYWLGLSYLIHKKMRRGGNVRLEKWRRNRLLTRHDKDNAVEHKNIKYFFDFWPSVKAVSAIFWDR